MVISSGIETELKLNNFLWSVQSPQVSQNYKIIHVDNYLNRTVLQAKY